jgi:hypothetical protein
VASRTVREKLPVILSHSICDNLSWQPQGRMQMIPSSLSSALGDVKCPSSVWAGL